ncbi:hypothetical protein BDR06DRAFT_967432 [Suillus hirtellus]|nr:hypothetical protein BDR06DRAFT_967432 [Suillus hirtellus]
MHDHFYFGKASISHFAFCTIGKNTSSSHTTSEKQQMKHTTGKFMLWEVVASSERKNESVSQEHFKHGFFSLHAHSTLPMELTTIKPNEPVPEANSEEGSGKGEGEQGETVDIWLMDPQGEDPSLVSYIPALNLQDLLDVLLVLLLATMKINTALSLNLMWRQLQPCYYVSQGQLTQTQASTSGPEEIVFCLLLHFMVSLVFKMEAGDKLIRTQLVPVEIYRILV